MRLRPGLSDEFLLSRIFRFHRLHARSERGLGYYLLDFDRRGLYRKHGCAGTLQFAGLKLQLPPRKTRELLRMARALEGLPEIDEAYTTNRISWSAVREVTRVATKETEAEWIELAENQSLRKIEHVVSRTRRGEPPCQDAYGLTGSKFKVVAELPPEDYAVWEAAFARIASQSKQILGNQALGDGHPDTQLDAASVLMVLAQSFLEQPLNPAEKERRSAYQVVYHRCPGCERAWLQTADGPAGIPVSKVAQREEVARVVCLDEDMRDVQTNVLCSDEEGVDMQPSVACFGGKGNVQVMDTPRGAWVKRSANSKGRQRQPVMEPASPEGDQGETLVLVIPHDPRGSRESCGFSGVASNIPLTTKKNVPPTFLKTSSVPLAHRDVPNSPVIRHQIMMRDGLLCAAPGCTNRAELNIHHVVWRSHGGRTEGRNLICLCRECHSLVHNAFLEIRKEDEGEGLVNGSGFRWFDCNGVELKTPVDFRREGK